MTNILTTVLMVAMAIVEGSTGIEVSPIQGQDTNGSQDYPGIIQDDTSLDSNSTDGPQVGMDRNYTAITMTTGVLYVVDRQSASLFALSLSTAHSPTELQTTVNKDQIQLRGRDSNVFLNPFLSQIGSGMESSKLGPLRDNDYSVGHDIHHQLYLANNNDIIIIHLLSGVYETVSIGHTIQQVKTLNYGDMYMFVHYEITELRRGYIQTYKQYTGNTWAVYGPPRLVTTPQWYDLDAISNILLFEEMDLHFYHSTIYMVIAEGYYIYFTELLRESSFIYLAPEPCDHIQRLVFNEHAHMMIIECLETLVIFNFTAKHFLSLADISNDTQPRVGRSYISTNGRFIAMVTNHSIELIHLNSQPSSVYVPNFGNVQYATFVRANTFQHYFCYVYTSSNGVYCVAVEQTLSQQTNTTRQLPGTDDIGSNLYKPFYSKHSLLVIPIENGIRIFDLSSFDTVWNVTTLDPEFLIWKPTHNKTSRITETTQATNDPLTTTSGISHDLTTIDGISHNPPTTTSEVSHDPTTTSGISHDPTTTSGVSHDPPTTTSGISHDPTTTSDISHDVPTTTTGAITSQDSTSMITQFSTTDSQLVDCIAELKLAESAYQRLLWICVGMCAVFCAALIISLVIIVSVMCFSRPRSHSYEKGQVMK